MVNKDSDVTLNTGDSFGLLPDLFWFKIVEPSMDSQPDTPDIPELASTSENENIADTEPIEEEKAAGPTEIKIENENENAVARRGHKRNLPPWLTQIGAKKSKNENNDQDDDTNEVDDNVASTSTMPVSPGPNANAHEVGPAQPVEQMTSEAAPGSSGVNPPANLHIRIKEEPADEAITIKQELVDDSGEDNHNEASPSTSAMNHNQNVQGQNVMVEAEPADSQDVSSSSAGLRESCTHGIRCYR